MARRKPIYVPHQSKISVQDVRDYSTPGGAAQANEEMRRLYLAIGDIDKKIEDAVKKQQQPTLSTATPTTKTTPEVKTTTTTTLTTTPTESVAPNWALTVLKDGRLVQNAMDVQELNFLQGDNIDFEVEGYHTKEYSTIIDGSTRINIKPKLTLPEANENVINEYNTSLIPYPLDLRNSGRFTTLPNVEYTTTDPHVFRAMNFEIKEYGNIDYVYIKPSSVFVHRNTNDETSRFIFRCEVPGTYLFSINCEVDVDITNVDQSMSYRLPFSTAIYIVYNQSIKPGYVFESDDPVYRYYREGIWQRVAITTWVPQVDVGSQTDTLIHRHIIPLKGTILCDLKCGDEVEFMRLFMRAPIADVWQRTYGSLSISRVRDGVPDLIGVA